MKCRKILAVILPTILVVLGCGSGTTSVLSGQPPAQATIDPRQTILCLGNAGINFGNLGERSSDDNVLVKMLLDTLETVFDQSCQTTIGTALTLLQQRVDPTTYLYVGTGKEQQPQIDLGGPVEVANCTSSPMPSDFYLGTPLWISVADPNKTNQDVVFQSTNFPATVPGDVASYLEYQTPLWFLTVFGRQATG